MALFKDVEVSKLENEQLAADRLWHEAQAREKRLHEKELKLLDMQHELNVKAADAELTKAKLKHSGRVDVVVRSILAVVKLPTLPFVLLFMLIALLIKRPVPKVLEDYVTL